MHSSTSEELRAAHDPESMLSRFSGTFMKDSFVFMSTPSVGNMIAAFESHHQAQQNVEHIEVFRGGIGLVRSPNRTNNPFNDPTVNKGRSLKRREALQS